MPSRTRLIAVGACAIDTILTVPHYPDEDSKLRATSFHKRRGGNAANTLEVLQQLICCDVTDEDAAIELHLIAVLPSPDSTSMPMIRSSFEHRCSLQPGDTPVLNQTAHAPHVDFSHCIRRPDYLEPVSSYVIASESTSSRTIVNHNALPEMTFDELKAQISSLLTNEPWDQLWFHFEGRNVDVAQQCMRWLRRHPFFHATHPKLRISIEIEKPGRPGLQELVLKADVVFYSRGWAEHEGYSDAEDFLNWQCEWMVGQESGHHVPPLPCGRTFICTWGVDGASARHLEAPDGRGPVANQVIHSKAYIMPDQTIVDTTGAGDTFIAGVLFGLIYRDYWPLQDILDMANGLAGRKILQQGFDGLGVHARDWR